MPRVWQSPEPGYGERVMSLLRLSLGAPRIPSGGERVELGSVRPSTVPPLSVHLLCNTE